MLPQISNVSVSGDFLHPIPDASVDRPRTHQATWHPVDPPLFTTSHPESPEHIRAPLNASSVST
jgi:hypothetical protein